MFGKSKRPSASEDLVEAGEAGTEGEQQQAGQAVSQVEEDSAERALDEEDWKTMMSNEQLGVIEIIQTDTSATKVEDEARELSWEEYQERARQTQGKTLDQVFMDKFKVMRPVLRNDIPADTKLFNSYMLCHRKSLGGGEWK